MDDRSEAIDILTRMSTNHFYGHREQEAFKLGAEALSAERWGMWINGKCSVCGGHGPFWAVSKGYYKSNYCPYCGAKMDEVSE